MQVRKPAQEWQRRDGVSFNLTGVQLLAATAALALSACSNDTKPLTDTRATASTSQAVFVNGDFETGDFTGWTKDAGTNYGITYPPTRGADLAIRVGGTDKTKLITGATESIVAAGLDGGTLRVPRYGTHAVVVNELGNNHNANILTQRFTTGSSDVDPSDGKVHVRFALAPVLYSGGHAPADQPYFWAQLRNITKGTVLFSTFNFADQPGVPWKRDPYNGNIFYTDWQAFDVAPGNVQLAIGDTLEIEVIAAGCSATAHFGEVYVDGFGAFLPGISVTAAAPEAANAGSDLTYTFNYGNRGSGAATNTKVQFNLPTGVAYKSLSAPGASCTAPSVGETDAGVVECNVGTVNPNAAGSFTVTTNINASATGKISAGNYNIRADSVSALIGPLVETTITSNVQYADLAAAIQDSLAALGWGQTHTFNLVVTNNGPATATGATVDWAMPAQYSSATWSCSATGTGSCGTGSGSGGITGRTVTLAQGESATFAVSAVVVGGTGTGSLSNLLTVAPPAGTIDNNSSNSQAIHNASIGTLRTITFSKAGLGTGRVVSVPSAIDCASGCSTQAVSFIDGMSVSLTATASTGSTFNAWAGACSGVGNPCNFTVNGDATVTATFDPPTYAVIVSPTPTNGTVVCTTPVVQGSSSTCTITPSSGYGLSALTDNTADVLSQVSGGQYVISDVTAAHTIAATFTFVPPSITVSPGSATYDALGPAVALDPGVLVAGPNDVTGATVTVGTGFEVGDQLHFTDQLGITGSYDAAKGVLTLTGSRPTADYETALASVTYSSSNGATPSTAVRIITFALGTGVSYQANAHFYEYISGSDWTWPQAQTAAAARAYYGLHGYLATIGDSAENAYVSAKLNGAGWMGAATTAGAGFNRTWSWVTGPETGTAFCYNSASGTCSSVDGGYSNWNTNEPNNSGGVEYRAQFLANGLWNDLPNTSTLPGYVVEYGGSSNDPVLTITGSRNLQVRAATTLTVASTLNPAQWAQDVTFSAHLVPTAATGSVQFLIDGSSFGPLAPISAGVATSGTITILTIGDHVVTATYAGDTERQAANGTLTGGQRITKASNGGGTCEGGNAATVCVSGVCDPDGHCGYANDDGPCTGSNASTVCRTGVCDPDGRCGYADGDGTCVPGSSTPVCRSGACGQVSGICRNGALNGCGDDRDCLLSQYCDGNTFTCATKVASGVHLPNDPRHNAGVCTVPVGAAVCQAGTCETGDSLCGVANNHACTTSTNCRSGGCGSDGKCGVPNDGACTSAAVCRTGVCDSDGKCGAPNGGSCTNGAACRSGVCEADQKCGVPNGGSCTSGTECRAGVCATDGRCGEPNGDPCTSGTSCRTGSCTAGQCSATCASTADCGAGLYCGSSSTCVPRLPNDSGCTAASQCLTNICTAGRCGSPSGDPCATANDCRAGACVSGTCGSACAADAQCATDFFCSAGGSCVANKPNGDACTASSQCRSGVCNPDGQCGAKTGEPCAGASDCRSGICNAASTCATTCASSSECVAGDFCSTSSHACLSEAPNGGPCTGSGQCQSSVCEADQLCGASNGKPCGQPDNCRSGVCSSDGKCGSPNGGPCAAADTCRSNVCDTDGKCGGAPGTSCTSDAACRAGLCGADGKCGEPNGSPCSTATDCRSGVCAADGVCGDDKGTPCLSPDTCRTGACSSGSCSLSCQADAECASGTFCSAGFCRAGLPNGDPCARAAQCQAGVCGADGQCGAPPGAGCATPSNCRAGACASGTCGPTCSADSECIAADFCASGTCTPRHGNATSCTAADECSSKACVGGTCGVPNGQPCSAPSQCKSGICDDQSGSCSATCASNAQCATATSCDATSHRCEPSAPNGEPPRRPCTSGAQCTSGVCGGDGVCGVPNGDPCVSGAVCRGGACVSGTCGAGCTADPQCASDAYCTASGTCAPKVATGGSCTRPAVCESGTCASDSTCGTVTGGACTAPIQCRAGACSNGTCGTSCTNDSECRATSFCSRGTCAPKLPSGAQCTTAPQCEGGVCAADGRCGKPQGDPCAAAIQCRGAICSAGVCAASCVADADCPTHEYCDGTSHVCLPQGDNGEGGSRTCEGPADCASGVCAPDGRCGYPSGGGSCNPANATVVCRSGACSSTSGTCVPGGGVGCSGDVDCAAIEHYCDAPTLRCTPKLPAGTPLPTDTAMHNGGVCTPAVAQAVCVGGQCDPADDTCGLPNSRTCTSAVQCRSGVCVSDGACGFPNGGACLVATVCRSGQCVDGVCGLPNRSPCLAASECSSGVCTAGVCGVPNGGRCTVDQACQSALCGTDGYCGAKLGGGCFTGDDCRSGTCVSHACADPCTATSQCAQGLACFAGGCAPKAANGGSCAAASECASGLCSSDGQCGQPTGDACTSAASCRSSACTNGHCATGCVSDTNCLTTSACVDGTCVARAPGGSSCTRDAQCAASQCVNGTCGRADGQACQAPVACRSNICSQSGTCVATCTSNLDCATGTFCGSSHTCVTAEGNGQHCASGAQCTSGVCEADGTCGYADGDGACTSLDAASLCRSGACGAASRTCVPAGGNGCSVDADCDSTGYCVPATRTCATKLGLGQPIPKDSRHGDGVCSKDVGAAICASGVCDEADDLCGMPNDGVCTSHAQCRGGSCGPDGRCGLLNGTTCTQAAACRSGTCDADGKCGSLTGGCTSSADCRSGPCSSADHHCGLPGGTRCAANAECRGGVCAADDKCGADNGASCTSGDECRSGSCVSQRCSTSCAGDASCGAGRFCFSGDCVARGVNGTACTRATQCTSGVCGSDGKCGQANGASCTSPTDCRVACASGACSTGCAADADCGHGTYCQAGVCIAGHSNGEACPANAQCASGLCSTDGTCGVATGGACVRPSDCRSGICEREGTCASSCASSTDCPASAWCDAATHTCQPVAANGATCTSSAQCSSGVCGLNALCGGAQGEACGAGSMCQSGVCDPTDLSCGLGNGSSGCTEASQATVCRSGVCVNGTCGLADGAVCTADSQCASGSCSAGRTCAAKGSDAGLVLKGGSGCSSTGEAGLFPALALALLGWLAGRRRASVKRLVRTTSVGAALLAVSALGQEQQLVQGFAAQAFDPSYAGDRFFAAPEATTDGHLLPAVKATFNYGYQPVRITSSTTGHLIPQGVVVRDQFYLHLDGSLALFDRLRLDLGLPVVLAQTGDPQATGSKGVQGGRLGDLRVGLRGSLYGGAHDVVALGLQADLLLPTGSQEDFAGAGSTRGHVRFIVSGLANEHLAYSAALGVLLASHHELGVGDTGSSLTYSAAVAMLFAGGQLQVGPELFGSTVLASGTTPLEALLGARYRWSSLVLGAGIGAGLTGAAGAAAVRGLVNLAWEPRPQPVAAQPVAAQGDCTAAVKQAVQELDARDRDGDGVVDSLDACPLEAGARNQSAALNGCPVDRDQDGVADEVDACPNEPGLKANRGCPPAADRDGDGVADAEDLCPDVRGLASAPKKGCPLEGAQLNEARIDLVEQVQFPNGKAELLAQSEDVLRSVAKVMQAHPELIKLSIDGFTDNRGSPASNLKLSGDRAASVLEWLVEKGGIERARLVSKGYGVEKPVATNDDEAGRQRNRRVEVRVLEYRAR